MQDTSGEAAGCAASVSMADIKHDIEATEQTLLAIATKEPDTKESKQAAATSLLALLRLKAQTRHASSPKNHQLVRDSCASLLTPQLGSRHSSHPSSQAQSALLVTKLQECCSVLEPVIDKATVSELIAVLDSLYIKQLQLLSHRSQAQMPRQPESLPATAAPVYLDALNQPVRQDILPPGHTHASGEHSPRSHRRVAEAMTWQEPSTWKGAPDMASPGGAPDLALPEDVPNLASPAPGAFDPLAGWGPPWGPPAVPPSISNPHQSSDLLPGERGDPSRLLHSDKKSAVVEVDRHGRVVASSSAQHAAAATSPRAGVVTAADREAALRTQLEEVCLPTPARILWDIRPQLLTGLHA